MLPCSGAATEASAGSPSAVCGGPQSQLLTSRALAAGCPRQRHNPASCQQPALPAAGMGREHSEPPTASPRALAGAGGSASYGE